MTIYNPFQDTGQMPGPPGGVDSTSYDFGLFFTVSTACQINGVWWYVASLSQYLNILGDEQIALWTINGTGAGHAVYVSGSVATAGVYSSGWNLISFSSPIALTAGIDYIAVKGISSQGGTNNYTASSEFFASAGAGTNGISDGPVLAYSDGPTGTSNKEPFGNGQQSFHIGSNNSAPPDVTTGMGSSFSQFDATWYGMDIQIQTSVTPPVTITTYSMRLS